MKWSRGDRDEITNYLKNISHVFFVIQTQSIFTITFLYIFSV